MARGTIPAPFAIHFVHGKATSRRGSLPPKHALHCPSATGGSTGGSTRPPPGEQAITGPLTPTSGTTNYPPASPKPQHGASPDPTDSQTDQRLHFPVTGRPWPPPSCLAGRVASASPASPLRRPGSCADAPGAGRARYAHVNLQLAHSGDPSLFLQHPPHPIAIAIAIATIVVTHGGDEVAAIAALLHEPAEDCGGLVSAACASPSCYAMLALSAPFQFSAASRMMASRRCTL